MHTDLSKSLLFALKQFTWNKQNLFKALSSISFLQAPLLANNKLSRALWLFSTWKVPSGTDILSAGGRHVHSCFCPNYFEKASYSLQSFQTGTGWYQFDLLLKQSENCVPPSFHPDSKCRVLFKYSKFRVTSEHRMCFLCWLSSVQTYQDLDSLKRVGTSRGSSKQPATSHLASGWSPKQKGQRLFWAMLVPYTNALANRFANRKSFPRSA